MKRDLNRKAKLSIYLSINIPTLKYCHELRVVTARTKSQIQAYKMSFIRRVDGPSLSDRVRRSDIQRELGVQPLLLWVERGPLRWVGHLEGLPPGRHPLEVCQACLPGRRSRGRPRTRWRNYTAHLAWERLRSAGAGKHGPGERDVWNTLPLRPNPGYTEENGWIDLN